MLHFRLELLSGQKKIALHLGDKVMKSCPNFFEFRQLRMIRREDNFHGIEPGNPSYDCLWWMHTFLKELLGMLLHKQAHWRRYGYIRQTFLPVDPNLGMRLFKSITSKIGADILTGNPQYIGPVLRSNLCPKPNTQKKEAENGDSKNLTGKFGFHHFKVLPSIGSGNSLMGL